ncbi:DUF4913 domain-containing protein [Streptomyces sp. WAC02707]|uniref:DUF4913 domain-containing protein n=1 Tax=Streptomyces sp. WAC02707 TaxID=2487417 RepID=UPI000F795C2F|nr:DUF4913 domain-containing protein [Streptomyces sp. WAC02707]RSS97869.1 DUF4913 domain-containing protein [Streptomyces sp. WAC02707]
MTTAPDSRPADGQAGEGTTADEPQGNTPVFQNLEQFVTERLAPVLLHPSEESGQIWCPRWWDHADAVSRLQAIWHTWEVLRWEPGTGMSHWHLHHLDPQWRALLDPVHGPFRECRDGRRMPGPLPLEPAPDGWFENEWDPEQPFSLD